MAGAPGDGSSATQVLLSPLGASGVAALATTDVGAHRRRARAHRLGLLAGLLAVVAALLVARDLFAP
ncbi:MAG: hypothetical protein JO368_06965, partial [Acidimicrobiales bacterium]|nr:hypothetical protein [Acidimicrobiales bacterium]